MGCSLPGISTARTWWGSDYPEAVIKQPGLMCPAMAAEQARSASESSNTVTFTLEAFQHSGKDFSQTGTVSCVPVSSGFSSVLPCFLSFFFQALDVKAVSPWLLFRTSESRVSRFESTADAGRVL